MEKELVSTHHAATTNEITNSANAAPHVHKTDHDHDHHSTTSDFEVDDDDDNDDDDVDDESPMNHEQERRMLDVLEQKAANRGGGGGDDAQVVQLLPETVTTLDYYPPDDVEGFPVLYDDVGNKRPIGRVYLVGTAHFSEESQEDVRKTIQTTQPDVVMVELCSSRTALLSMDEAKLLEEAKNLNVEKIMANIRQSGVVQGVMHCMLLSMSAHITKQLGMAPGGEFRVAYKESQQIPACKMQLGDRPVQITLQRAFGSLNAWQKLRLFGGLLWSHGMKITKEDIEKTKRKDLLEEILREMAGEFPDLSRIFVEERDQYMAHVLRCLTRDVYLNRCLLLMNQDRPLNDVTKMPVTIVGVVGIGHAPGIAANWTRPVDIAELIKVPAKPKWPRYVIGTVKGALLGIVSYFVYKGGHRLYSYYKG